MRAFLLVLVLLLGFEASAVGNFFIPNYYKNRRTMNSYSAIGWSDRHEVMLEYNHSMTAENTGGVRSSDNNSDSYEPMAFYRLENNINLEFDAYRISEADSPVKVGGANGVTTNYYQGSVGYEFTNTPLALGASYSSRSIDTTSGTANSITNARLYDASIGAGYRLPSDIYLGVGFLNQNQNNGRTDLTNRTYLLGAGKVFGDKKSPMAAGEGYLAFTNNNGTQTQTATVRGLYNYSVFQYYAVLSYGLMSGTRAGSGYDTRLGLDYEFANFYVGPELYYTTTKTDLGTQADTANTLLSLEAGYRIARLEAYLRFGNSRASQAVDKAQNSSDSTINGLTAGFIYKF